LIAQPPAPPSAAGNSRLVQPKDRITDVIDDRKTVVRSGNRHPMARPEFDTGMVANDFPMNRMILAIESDAEQQAALERLLEAQQQPDSPLYQKWLTPEEFGRQFGISDRDLSQVGNWLEGHGFQVEEVSSGRRSIVFSGTAGQVRSAFHTEIHAYNVNGERHIANAGNPRIPRALARVVRGVVSLHDFRSARLSSDGLHEVESLPADTLGGAHYLAPADFATIYDVGGLYSNSIDGSGRSIAIAGRCTFNLTDVQAFRNNFGLPPNDPTVIVNGTDPGFTTRDDEIEALLDVEWSGAVAKNAAIKYVASASTGSTDGVALSAQYIVNNNIAPVVSVSYGLCEVALGAAGNSFWNGLWQQAAAQGITVVVASGDSGTVGCSPANAATPDGVGVNGMCSTPYSVCVGGTQFSDTSNPGLYWSATNSPVGGSALSYIPEAVWNQSSSVGGSGLWSSGGGVSLVYPKPSWQSGPGVPADGHRDVPDLSLNAATHDGYLVMMNNQFLDVGGTSASAPAFAGLMALVLQRWGVNQGNPNPILYTLATQQASGGAAVFHDIVSGSNYGITPQGVGDSAGPGYDLATGIGSVDALLLVNHWKDGQPVPTFQLNTTPSLPSVNPGSSATLTVSVTLTAGFNSAVALLASGLPAGITTSFSPPSLPAPGSGSSTLTVSAPSNALANSYTLTITATGGGVTQTANVTLKVNPAPTTQVTLPSNLIVGVGQSMPLSLALSAPAPPSGIIVTVTSSDTSKMTLRPANVLIPAGATTPTSPPQVTGMDFGTAAITASAAGLLPASQTVQVTDSIGFSPGSISVGTAVRQNVFVILSAPAPSAGLTINLSSDNPAVANAPATVTFMAGTTIVSVSVMTGGPGATLIHGSALPNIADTTISVTVTGPTGPLTITTTSLKSGQAGSSYSQTLAASGGKAPYSWTLTAGTLPNGLTLNQATGQISGTPATAANAPLSFKVTDLSVPAQTATANFTLTIAPSSVTMSIAATSGSGQTAAIGAPFANPLVATVKDSAGNPVSGVNVTFTAPVTGASGGFAGGLNTAVTNSAGVATSAILSANATAGTYVVAATAPGISTAASFILANAPGAPASIVATSGSGQSATIGGPFAKPLVATVKDSGGNAVPGITVMFNAPSTGPGGSFAGGVNTAVTNSAGVATAATFTANGSVGSYVVSASVAGVALPATFSLTNAGVSGIVLPSNLTVGVGQTVLFPVTLSAPAPPSGIILTFTSSDTSKITVRPTNVLIPAGATTPPSPPQVTGLDFGSAAITASTIGLPSASQTVQVTDSISFSPGSISMSAPARQNVFVTLSAPAPAAGLTINLSSDNPAVASVPATVTFVAGTTIVSATVWAVGPGATLIHASALPNIADTTVSVTVTTGP
jgi:pseudomonalisin